MNNPKPPTLWSLPSLCISTNEARAATWRSRLGSQCISRAFQRQSYRGSARRARPPRGRPTGLGRTDFAAHKSRPPTLGRRLPERKAPHAHCTGAVLVLYGRCTSTLPVHHERCTGTEMILHWRCTGTWLAPIWCCTGATRVLHWHCTGTSRTLHWYCAGQAMVQHWYCNGTNNRGLVCHQTPADPQAAQYKCSTSTTPMKCQGFVQLRASGDPFEAKLRSTPASDSAPLPETRGPTSTNPLELTPRRVPIP